MKKKARKRVNPSIYEELKQLFTQQETFEYHIFIDEQEFMRAKGQYLELLMRVERSVFPEEERKEIEDRMAKTWKKIQTMETKLNTERERIVVWRERLERVRDAYEARHKKPIHKRHD